MSDTKKQIPTGPERRYYENTVQVVTREGEEDSRMIRGYFCKFDSLSRNLGWFREKIARSAFDDVDFTDSDIVALVNHDTKYIVGRTIADPALIVGVDDVGGYYEFEAPNTTAGNDLLENVKRKIVQHSSFSWPYGTVEDTWEEDEELGEIRTITKFKKIIDVSPVVNPAYLQTSVDARNADGAKESYEAWKKDSGKGESETLTTRSNKAKRFLESREM